MSELSQKLYERIDVWCNRKIKEDFDGVRLRRSSGGR